MLTRLKPPKPVVEDTDRPSVSSFQYLDILLQGIISFYYLFLFVKLICACRLFYNLTSWCGLHCLRKVRILL
jgi:hypothetical protein